MKSLTNASSGVHFRFRFSGDAGAGTGSPLLVTAELGDPTDCCDTVVSLCRLDLRLSQ
jgi:hypothetical protein